MKEISPFFCLKFGILIYSFYICHEQNNKIIMNKFEIDLIVNGSIDDITKALRSIADAIEDAKGEHEVAILDGVDNETWEIENSSFSIITKS